MGLLVLLLQLKIKSHFTSSDSYPRPKNSVAWNENRATFVRMEQSSNQVTQNIENTPQLGSYNDFGNTRSCISFC